MNETPTEFLYRVREMAAHESRDGGVERIAALIDDYFHRTQEFEAVEAAGMECHLSPPDHLRGEGAVITVSRPTEKRKDDPGVSAGGPRKPRDFVQEAVDTRLKKILKRFEEPDSRPRYVFPIRGSGLEAYSRAFEKARLKWEYEPPADNADIAHYPLITVYKPEGKE